MFIRQSQTGLQPLEDREVRNGVHATDRPYRVVAAQALQTYPISATETLVARVLLDHASRPGFQCYVGIERIARESHLSDRSVRNSLKRLAAAGVITFLRYSKGGVRSDGRGIPHHFQLDFALESQRAPGSSAVRRAEQDTQQNPEAPSGFDELPPSLEPGTSRARTRKPTAVNPEAASGEASIHHPMRSSSDHAQTGFHDCGMGALPGVMNGCFPQPTDRAKLPSSDLSAKIRLKTRLAELGVAGRNLDLIANAPGITTGLIDRTWRKVQVAPAVRNRPAYLVKLLSDAVHVDVSGGSRLNHADANAIAKIEELRRKRGIPQPKPRIADEIGTILQHVVMTPERQSG